MPIVRKKMANTINFIGFENDKEFLFEKFDTFDSNVKLRQLFLNLTNNILGSICHFSKYEQEFLSKKRLKNAFTYKINRLLQRSYVKKISYFTSFNFCLNSTKIINNYFSKKSKINTLFSTKDLLPAAKLISHCFINGKIQLLIDKNLLFHEFVLNRVKKMHKDKEVIDYGDSISVKAKDICSLKIYTSWKKIDSKNLNINTEINSAVKCIKEKEFNQIYLAYPKDSNFLRHIPIEIDGFEDKIYQIKAIPYSLRSVIKNKQNFK